MYDVVTIGDASEDIFVRPHKFNIEVNRKFASGKGVSFELGEKISLDNVFYDIGGSACNSAVSFARQGFVTSIITATGKDSPSEKIWKRLDDEGVDTSNIKSSNSIKTNFSVIFNLEEERTIFVCHGIDDYSLLAPKKSLKTKWVYLCPMGENTTEVENRLISMASEKGVKIAWNPGSLQIEKGASEYRALLKNVRIIILNKEEAFKFINYPVRPVVADVAGAISKIGPKIVVITDGKVGAYCYDGSRSYEVETLNQERVDATGAGDSFASAFIGRFFGKKDESFSDQYLISDALKAGIINSTSVVHQLGAEAGLLSMTDINNGISENPRMIVEVF